MKLSMRWYLTYYSKGLHRYCHILKKCTTQISVSLIAALSTNKGKYITVFLDFSIHPNI